MPTLQEVSITPAKAEFPSSQDTKKSSTIGDDIPRLIVIEDNNDKRKNKSSTKKDNDGSAKQKPRRGDRQISIFESIGIAPPKGTAITPKASKADTSNAASSSKKKRKSAALTVKEDSFPICVQINAEGKDTKKVMITCHGIKREFRDAIVKSPIVLTEKEKRSIPKDPVARFLGGFGRFLH